MSATCPYRARKQAVLCPAYVLAHLDGTGDHAPLCALVESALAEGRFTLPAVPEGESLTVADAVEVALEELRSGGVLLG